jgi:hypothetical protein
MSASGINSAITEMILSPDESRLDLRQTDQAQIKRKVLMNNETG